MRIMAPIPMMPRYVVATPYGVRGNMPNQNYRHSTAEYNVIIQTNSSGIRESREIPYEKPPGIKRVVLLGDSFGMGYGANADEMFTSQMKRYLKTKLDIAVEVVNLSTSGHGNAEELIVLLNEGIKYAPDLVLLAWHHTDLADNVRSNLFDLTDGSLVETAKSYLPGVKERQFLNQFFLYRFLAEHSQIYNFCRNWAGNKIKKLQARARLLNPSRKQNLEKQAWTTLIQYQSELTIALLERIEQVSNESNGRFLILDIPFKLSRTEFESRFPYEYMSDVKTFPIVSPISKFKENSPELMYWEKSAGHFTPLGCRLVGEALADFIQQHRLLDSPK